MKSSKKKAKKKKGPKLASFDSSSADASASSSADAEERGGSVAGDAGAEERLSEQHRDLAWLVEAFAVSSVEEIEAAYRVADGDPFRAAGILGAHLEERGIEEGLNGSFAETRQSSRKAQLAAAASGLVSNVAAKGCRGTRSPRAAGSSGSSNGERSGHVKAGTVSASSSSSGMEYSVEEAELFLCSMLGEESELGMGVVKDVLAQYGNNIEKALDALLDFSNSSSYGNMVRRCSQSENTKANPASMVHGIPAPSNEECSSQMLFCSGYGLDCPDGTSSWFISKLTPESLANPTFDVQHKVLNSLFKVPETSARDPKSMNWKSIVKKLEPISTNNPVKWNTVRDKDLRADATKYWDSMKLLYQKAATAYARGERAYASYLAEEAMKQRKLARKADEKASIEIFQARNRDIKNTITIDLHGQHVKEAMRLLKLHLLLCVNLTSAHLRVITGCGLDGPGKGKIKQAVLDLAERESIQWSEENQGTLLLQLSGQRQYSFVEHDSDIE